MKKIILSLVLCFAGIAAFGQDSLRVYCDSLWNELPSKEGALRYKQSFFNQEGMWEVNYYNIENKKLKRETYTKTPNGLIKDGRWTTWDVAEGYMDSDAIYVRDTLTFEHNFYPSGKVEQFITYAPNEVMFPKSVFFTEEGIERKFKQPEYSGGAGQMYRFLGQNINYPRSMRRKNITGKVIISFKVCTDGTLCDYKILKTPHEELSKEAIRVISSMPKWTPGTLDGNPMKVKYTLPINFTLE